MHPSFVMFHVGALVAAVVCAVCFIRLLTGRELLSENSLRGMYAAMVSIFILAAVGALLS